MCAYQAAAAFRLFTGRTPDTARMLRHLDVLLTERADRYEDLPKGAAEKVKDFLALVERYRQSYEHGQLAAVTRKLLEEIGYKDDAKSLTSSQASADRKLKSIDHVINSLEAFEKREGPKASLLT